jgi:hypothetical protein
MFETLTKTEATELDLHLFHSEREMKGMISNLITRRQTSGITAKVTSYAKMVGEVHSLRDELVNLI